MNIINNFKSLTGELEALQNRIRNLIGTNHLLSDGEWKESILRSIIRRHLPANIEVGRGFLVNNDNCSTQVDILFYDNNFPILFRDGDLFFLTSDASKGIIEVKTRIDTISSLRTVLEKLANNISLISNYININSAFYGVFAYESRLDEENADEILNMLKEVCQNRVDRLINHICLGKRLFIKYWSYSPETLEQRYNKWHIYELEGLAPGYFINNIVNTFSYYSVSAHQQTWFPSGGKEGRKISEIEF